MDLITAQNEVLISPVFQNFCAVSTGGGEGFIQNTNVKFEQYKIIIVIYIAGRKRKLGQTVGMFAVLQAYGA